MPKASPSKLIVGHFAELGKFLVRSMECDPVLPSMQMCERVSAFDNAATLLRRANLARQDRANALRVVGNLKLKIPAAYKKHRAAGGGSGSNFDTDWFRYLAKRVGEPN